MYFRVSVAVPAYSCANTACQRSATGVEAVPARDAVMLLTVTRVANA